MGMAVARRGSTTNSAKDSKKTTPTPSLSLQTCACFRTGFFKASKTLFLKVKQQWRVDGPASATQHVYLQPTPLFIAQVSATRRFKRFFVSKIYTMGGMACRVEGGGGGKASFF